MPYDYSEDQLVEQPAIKLFEELGRETAGVTRPAGFWAGDPVTFSTRGR